MALIETIPVKDDYRRKLAYKLMMEGVDASPVQHWAQGLARLGQSAIGGYEMYQADKRDKETEAGNTAALIAALNGGAPAAAMPTPQRPTVTPSAPVTSVTPSAGAVPAMLAGDVPGKVMPKTETNPNGGMYGGLNWRPVDSEPPPDTKIAANGPVALPPAAAAPAAPAAPPAPAAPAPTDTQMADAKARLVQMLQSDNPQMRKLGQNMAQALIAKQLAGKEDPQYEYKERPDGSLIAVDKKNPANFRVVPAPGGGQDAIKFEADKAGAVEQAKRVGSVQYEADKAAAVAKAKGEAEKAVGQADRDKQQKQVGRIVTDDIDRAINLVDNSKLPTTGQLGSFLSKVGGTAANDVRALVDTVKANAGFAELQKMRDNSPTGGALGNVSELEIAYLQATIGNLEQSQSEDQFKYNLRRVKNAYMDIIHGEGRGPVRENLGATREAKPAGKPLNTTKTGVKWTVE